MSWRARILLMWKMIILLSNLQKKKTVICFWNQQIEVQYHHYKKKTENEKLFNLFSWVCSIFIGCQTKINISFHPLLSTIPWLFFAKQYIFSQFQLSKFENWWRHTLQTFFFISSIVTSLGTYMSKFVLERKREFLC